MITLQQVEKAADNLVELKRFVEMRDAARAEIQENLAKIEQLQADVKTINVTLSQVASLIGAV